MKDPDINDRVRRDGVDATRRHIDDAPTVTNGRHPSRRAPQHERFPDALAAFPFSTFDDATAAPASKRWLLKGLLACGETSVWIGGPGSLKSALLTDIAVSIAAN